MSVEKVLKGVFSFVHLLTIRVIIILMDNSEQSVNGVPTPETPVVTKRMNNPDAVKNLKPFKPGQSGNPNGRPKGRRSLSTIIKDMLEEEINWDTVPLKDVDAFKKKYSERSAWEAIVDVAVSKAIAGDTRAMNFLSKSGYGDKITHDFDPGFFSKAKVEVEIVKPVNAETPAIGETTPSADAS